MTWTLCPLKMGSVACSETSVNNYPSTLRHILEEPRRKPEITRRCVFRTSLSSVQWLGYGLDCLVFESWQRGEITLFSRTSRSTVKPTHPPVTWVPEFFPGGKAAGAWSCPLLSSAQVKNEWSCTFTPRTCFYCLEMDSFVSFYVVLCYVFVLRNM